MLLDRQTVDLTLTLLTVMVNKFTNMVSVGTCSSKSTVLKEYVQQFNDGWLQDKSVSLLKFSRTNPRSYLLLRWYKGSQHQKRQDSDASTCLQISLDFWMQEIQDTLAAFYHRIEVIEKSLKSSLLASEDRESMEKELQDITKKLSTLESNLQGLRRENSKIFAFAVLLMFFSFLGYGLYVMTFGPP